MNKLLYPANENGTYDIPVTFRDRDNSIVSDARVERVIVSLQNREGDYIVNRDVATVGVQDVSLSGDDLQIEDQTKDQELRIFTVDAVVDDRPVHMEWEMYIKKLIGAKVLIDEDTIFLAHCDGVNTSTSFLDSALGGNAPHTITAINATQVSTAQSVFGGSSCLLANSTDRLTLPDDTDFDLGAANFTFEYRVRFNSLTSSLERMFYAQNTGTGPSDSYIQFFLSTVTNKLYFFGQDSGVVVADYSASWSPSLDTWYHLACVRSGASVTIYVDGTALSMIEDVAIGSTALPNLSTPIHIGGRADRDYGIQGYVDEVRVLLRAEYTANFTPSTVPFTPYL